MCGIPDDDDIHTTEIDTCESTNSIGVGGILGITLPVLFVICCCGWTFYKHKKVPPPTDAPKPKDAPAAPAAATHSTNALHVASVSYAIPANNAQVTYGGVTAVIPPSASAPPMNPAFHVRT